MYLSVNEGPRFSEGFLLLQRRQAGRAFSRRHQPERSSAGSSARNRAGSNGDRSVLLAAPSAISSAKASPVAGALRIPHTLWPVAM